jgi:N-acetylneuraminic acid mutarotase
VPPKIFLPAAVVVGDNMYLFGGAISISELSKNESSVVNDMYRF